MAQNPVVWALGVIGTAAIVALYSGQRLDRLTETDRAPTAAAVTPLAANPVAAKPPPRAGSPTLTVSADYRGHYHVFPTVDAYRVRMLVDTGASVVALTAEDARALGFDLRPSDYKTAMSTANGIVRGARVNLREVRLGDILVRNVEAVVLPAGALSISLLGTSFLGKLKGYEVQTGKMILRG